MINIDTTKLMGHRPLKVFNNCKVTDLDPLSKAALPREIEVQMPDADGAKMYAMWHGTPVIAVNDYVRCIRDTGDTSLMWVIGPGGGTSETGGGVVLPGTSQARLTLSSTLPVTTTDQTAATTLYWLPYRGDQLSLYDGTNWTCHTIPAAGVSISLSGKTADKNNDVFVYDNSGTLTLEFVEWTNDTTRATAIALQNGVYIKSGDTSRLYVGTIRTTSVTGQCEDSDLKRYVWNHYNQELRHFEITESTSYWTYTTATWRSWNNSTSNRCEFVIGLDQLVWMDFRELTVPGAGKWTNIGIALDATNTNDANINTSAVNSDGTVAHAMYFEYPGIGYHYLQLVETGSGVLGTGGFYGAPSGTLLASTPQEGAVGWLYG